MGHNYARPATSEQRLARVLSRIPADWAISIERGASSDTWRAITHAPDQTGEWGEATPGLVEALEAAWRLNRGPAA